jgi:hypothetical protein
VKQPIQISPYVKRAEVGVSRIPDRDRLCIRPVALSPCADELVEDVDVYVEARGFVAETGVFFEVGMFKDWY